MPPVARLRRDRPLPDDVAAGLIRFWETAGLPNAGESITSREILRAVFDRDYPASHAFFYLRKPMERAAELSSALHSVFVEQDAGRRSRSPSSRIAFAAIRGRSPPANMMPRF
jgi:hypothetical protein